MREVKVEIERSNRKTISIQVKRDGRVVIRAPRRMSTDRIRKFVDEHTDWIAKQLDLVEAEREKDKNTEKLTEKELADLIKEAKEVFPEKVEYYANLLGVSYGRITIRHQRTRWGSCSSKGNLNFNCLLMLAPDEVVDSVVVHELCHRLEMNHSDRFYKKVLSIYPEYHKWNGWLKKHGSDLMRLLPE